MGHRPYQLSLDHQRALQVLGHAIERRRQAPDRVGIAGRYAGVEAPLGDARGGRLQPQQAPLQLAYQQVNDQADQAQAQQGNEHQQLRRIRVHLVKRPDFQDPGCFHHAGKHPDRIAALAQGHHRVAFIDAATLVFVHVGFIQGYQAQLEAKALALFQRFEPARLLADRVAHQFIDQQVNRRPRQLFADLLHLAGQQHAFPANLA
ncbi:hypothetical protein D3C85_975250 [compost metagenome]